jgi:hypothetical protein
MVESSLSPSPSFDIEANITWLKIFHKDFSTYGVTGKIFVLIIF